MFSGAIFYLQHMKHNYSIDCSDDITESFKKNTYHVKFIDNRCFILWRKGHKFVKKVQQRNLFVIFQAPKWHLRDLSTSFWLYALTYIGNWNFQHYMRTWPRCIGKILDFQRFDLVFHLENKLYKYVNSLSSATQSCTHCTATPPPKNDETL